MFPSWWSPPSHIQKSSRRPQTLKHTGWKCVWLWCETTTGFLFLTALLRHTDKPFLRCSALRFPRMVTNVCSSVPNFSSPALKRTYEHRNKWCHDGWRQRNFKIIHRSPYIPSLDYYMYELRRNELNTPIPFRASPDFAVTQEIREIQILLIQTERVQTKSCPGRCFSGL